MYHLTKNLDNNLLKRKIVNDFTLITYDKQSITSKNVETIGLFRSVIMKENKVFCFSPPKSVKNDIFMSQHPLQECVAEQFIEGTMINVFYSDGWNISTKKCVDAKTQFNLNEKMTYREMFLETMEFTFDELNTNYSYSFVSSINLV